MKLTTAAGSEGGVAMVGGRAAAGKDGAVAVACDDEDDELGAGDVLETVEGCP